MIEQSEAAGNAAHEAGLGSAVRLRRRGGAARALAAALALCCAFGVWATMSRADESPLNPYLWKNRVVIILADSNDRSIASRQRRMLAGVRGGLIERDMVVVSVVGDRVRVDGRGTDRIGADDLRRAVDTSTAAFSVLLIGKDGGVKLRSAEPVGAERLFALIDTMPMRRQEMRIQTDRTP